MFKPKYLLTTTVGNTSKCHLLGADDYRARKLKEPLQPFVLKTNKQHVDAIEAQYHAITADLQGLNAWRYSRNITGGNQEFMEAVTFQHYLETQTLISFKEAQARIAAMCKSKDEGPEAGLDTVNLTISDYILGVFDMVGEIMRFAITTMATTGELPSTDGRSVLTDLRQLRSMLESLEVEYSAPLGYDISKKMGVMQTCVEKVENALYGLTVRGAERPKGWMPDISQARGGEEIEGY
jgi:predicted translin family RNA/ssDNA-binding protein